MRYLHPLSFCNEQATVPFHFFRILTRNDNTINTVTRIFTQMIQQWTSYNEYCYLGKAANTAHKNLNNERVSSKNLRIVSSTSDICTIKKHS